MAIGENRHSIGSLANKDIMVDCAEPVELQDTENRASCPEVRNLANVTRPLSIQLLQS